MADRVYPSTKPATATATTNKGGGAGATAIATSTPNARLPPPPTKAQPYNPNRHPYRPNPTSYPRSRRRRRGCRSYLCICCFWSVLTIILLLLIGAIAGCVLYLLYHPHRPTFSITALKISQFNLTAAAADDTTRLTSALNLTISTKNPNKKITFLYDPMAVACLSHDTQIANGSVRSPFASAPNNITIIRSSLAARSLLLETETVNQIRSDLKKKKSQSGLPLKIVLDTEARVKIESMRTKKVGIRIQCDGIHGLLPKNSSAPVSAIVSDAKCKVDLRIKIWKWTF